MPGMTKKTTRTEASPPRVSIIIPTYNFAQYVTEALESIFQQEYDSYEVIVVDDGSTDNTCQVLEAYRERIRYSYKENGGMASALNHGLELMQGEFAAFLDADDMFLPGKLTDQMAVFEHHPSAGAVHSGKRIVTHDGKIVSELQPWQWAPSLDIKNMLLYNPVFWGGLIVRKSWLKKIGGWNATLRQAEDTDGFLRLALAGCKFVWLPKVTVAYRLHRHNITSNSPQRLEYVERVLDDFFARPDLPEDILALEDESRYRSLLWSSWHLFSTGFLTEMEQTLHQALTHIPSPVSVGTVLTWATYFSEWQLQYGRNPKELRALWPSLKRTLSFDETTWEALEGLLNWWIAQDLPEKQGFMTLPNLWNWVQTIERSTPPTQPLDRCLDGILAFWQDYFEGQNCRSPRLPIYMIQSLPLQDFLRALQHSIARHPRLITVQQIELLWNDLRQLGSVHKANEHDAVSLYLTVFGQALVKHRHWQVALHALKKALTQTRSRQALSCWIGFFRNVWDYAGKGAE